MDKAKAFLKTLPARLDFLPGLLGRITLGFIFVQAGWGKLHHLDKVTEFFRALGIPAPGLQAPFVATVEFVAGGLVLLGLLTRFAALPLIGTMAVALLTAKRPDIHELSDLLALPEYLFIVLSVWLAVKGAGAFSLDALLCRRCRTNNDLRPAGKSNFVS